VTWDLSDLPSPPAGRAGWPWTNGGTNDWDKTFNWPKISIVTPSYNQGKYIEETIRSVLLQGYPSLQYIIVDGKSNDETSGIISRYSRYVDIVIIENDDGQADAINKGFVHAKGDIFNWINSDDVLAQGALFKIGKAWRDRHAVAGSVRLFSDSRSFVLHNERLSTINLATTQCIYTQPGVWLDRKTVLDVGVFDVKYHYCFDKKHLMMYLDRFSNIQYIDDVLVHFRLHEESKTVSVPDRFAAEERKILGELAISLCDAANRQAVGRCLRVQRWYDELGRAIESCNKSKLQLIAGLLYEASKDPIIKFGRPLIGATLKILAR
jgi:glycosyltransferase involved in cell wall biosynthesis